MVLRVFDLTHESCATSAARCESARQLSSPRGFIGLLHTTLRLSRAARPPLCGGRRRYSTVVADDDFSHSLLAASVEDPEPCCRDWCHAWYLMSTCVQAFGLGLTRSQSSPLYIHLGSLNHLCTEPLSPDAPAAPSSISLSAPASPFLSK